MKRKCGTCKYFEDRGVAGSGVCQHIQRRELREVVLVRQTELACRNSWDQDLWEESPNPILNPALSGLDYPAVSGVGSDAPPPLASREDTTSKPGGQPATYPFEDDIDRVTGVQVPAPRRSVFARPHATAFATRDDESEEDQWVSRASVLDARRRLEEERRETARREQESRVSEIGARMSPSEAPRSTTDWSAPVEVDQPDAPRIGPSRASLGHQRGATAPQRQTIGDEYGFTTDTPRPIVTPPVAATRVDQATEPLPTQEVRAAVSQRQPIAPQDDRFIHVDGGVYGAPPRQATAAPSVPQVAPVDVDPIDRHAAIEAIKRCCGTCRDFRQIGEDGRGQCVNPYAFSERRMVQSDQLACRSSLGTWWMPNDDVWLERADTSHHGRPTPLLDAAIAAQRTSDDGRDSRRRHRRS